MTRNELRRKRGHLKMLCALLAAIAMMFLFVSICLPAQGSGGVEVQKPKREKAFGEEISVMSSEDCAAKKIDGEMKPNEDDERSLPITDEVPLDHITQERTIRWCKEYGVPYSVALAVIEAESSFRPDAENGSCYGYMQINSINKSWLLQEIGVTDLADQLQNLHSGIYMLGDLYGKYGDWHKALVCYNCGETGAYNHYFSQGLTSSGYSRHVMELEEKWAEVIPQ